MEDVRPNFFTRHVTDHSNPGSIAAKARAQRLGRFLGAFPDIAEMSVLDLGGTGASWRHLGIAPKRLVTLNLVVEARDEEGVLGLVGDACSPPKEVVQEQFDLVYSNSLLEHVGGVGRRQQLAEVIHGQADFHWVQTPYRYFPVEPHWVFPGFQWLPLKARVEIAQRWHSGYMKSSRDSSIRDVLWTELIDITEMKLLFPESELWMERMAGLVKSLVAVKAK